MRRESGGAAVVRGDVGEERQLIKGLLLGGCFRQRGREMMYGLSAGPGPEQEIVGKNDAIWLVAQHLGTRGRD